MRDPNRIDPIIDTVKEIWKKYPDMRFGQLICNIFSSPNFNKIDIWFCEDNIMLENLEKILKDEI